MPYYLWILPNSNFENIMKKTSLLFVLILSFTLFGCWGTIKEEVRSAVKSPEHQILLDSLAKGFQAIELTQTSVDQTIACMNEFREKSKQKGNETLNIDETFDPELEEIATKNGFQNQQIFKMTLTKIMVLGMYNEENAKKIKEVSKLNADSLVETNTKNENSSQDWLDKKMEELGKEAGKEMIGFGQEMAGYLIQDAEYLAKFSTSEERQLAKDNVKKLLQKTAE